MHVDVQRVCYNLIRLEPDRERIRSHVFGPSHILFAIQGARKSQAQRSASVRARHPNHGCSRLRHCDLDQRQNVLQLLHFDQCELFACSLAHFNIFVSQMRAVEKKVQLLIDFLLFRSSYTLCVLFAYFFVESEKPNTQFCLSYWPRNELNFTGIPYIEIKHPKLID